MPAQATVVWDDVFTRYNFGPTHPMNPVRLDLTARLCREMGLLEREDVAVIDAPVAPDEVLATVHDPEYIEGIKRADADPAGADPRFGIGTEDVPAFHGIHDSSARIAAGSLAIAQAVHRGESMHGVNFTGGMHHAMKGAASGFCIYNDAAVAIQWLLDQGVERVAYVDVDAHHGDGVERIFWDEPRVLTASLHETGRALFPGTGWANDIGGREAEGSAVNCALPPGAGDSGWLRALHSAIIPVVRAFRPQFIVSQHGTDAHFQDPLAHLAITVDAQRSAIDAMHRLSHEVCEGRWIGLGGGGYEVVDVVPRTWTHMTAIAAHAPIPCKTEVPAAWREQAKELTGREGPERMGDLAESDGPLWWRSWDMGYDPGSEIDRAIMATRQATFPLHGLDVYFD